MFKVHINDGQTPMPDDDIFYIVAKEGIFLKKKLGVMESVAPVKDISILQSIEKTAKMNIKKIPGGQFAQVMTFFKEVYKEHHGESIVLLFYDEEKKVYKIVPPHQKVNGAACDYDRGMTIEGMTMIGTIHSHANFSAFHSGTDQDDEEHFDGLHITIGHVNSDEVSISASIIANEHRFIINPLDYVERLEEVEITKTAPTTKTYKWVNGKYVQENGIHKWEPGKYVPNTTAPITTLSKIEKRYKINISEKYKRVNKQWMSMVEKKVYVQPKNQTSQYDPYTANGWGSGYESGLWKKHQTNVHPQGRIVKPVSINPTSYNQDAKIPTIHDIDIPDIEDIPCLTCANRTYKIFLEENGIDDEPDIYRCEQCQGMVIDEFSSMEPPMCPTCNTDEHLTQILEQELNDEYLYKNYEEEQHIVQNSKFVQCKECGQTFHLRDGEYTCPFCYSAYYVDGNKEDELENVMRADSGEFLDPHTEEINKMMEDMEHDIDVERIPDPNDMSVPVNKPRQISFSEKNDQSLVAMFKNVFGRKK